MTAYECCGTSSCREVDIVCNNDGTEGCCTGRCTGACGGYGFAFELAARNVRDGTTHSCAHVGGYFMEGSAEGCCAEPATAQVRRVAFIGQPSAGKTTTASCCGDPSDGTVEEEVFELPGFVGMIHSGKNDLAQRAKDIVRGRDGTLVCKCPVDACVCRTSL